MCNLNCQINNQVGGDHAYCDCECHKDTLPAIQPSRERRKLTKRGADSLKAVRILPAVFVLTSKVTRPRKAAHANR
jgi:hypothetical protein